MTTAGPVGPEDIADGPPRYVGPGAVATTRPVETVPLLDDDLRPPPPPAAKRASRAIFEWIVLIAAALVIAFLVKTFLVQAFYIPSESMVPTLKVGDRVLVNKLSYRLHDVHRGDVVVFEAPPGQASANVKDLVKRVIGLPGETIEGRDGAIYIDGRRLDENYLPPGTQSRGFPAQVVPIDSLFVLGDNRLASKDSTYFGPIPESSLVGKVFVRLWPLPDLTFF